MPINLSQVYGGGGGIGFIGPGVPVWNTSFGFLRVTVNHTASLEQRLALSGRYRIFAMRLETRSTTLTNKTHRIRIRADGSTIFDVSRTAYSVEFWGIPASSGGELIRGMFFDVEESLQIDSLVAENPDSSTWELIAMPLR